METTISQIIGSGQCCDKNSCRVSSPKVAIKNKGLCQYMEHYSHFFGLPVSAFSTLVLSFEFYIIETKIFTTISVRIPRQACWTETGRPNK